MTWPAATRRKRQPGVMAAATASRLTFGCLLIRGMTGTMCFSRRGGRHDYISSRRSSAEAERQRRRGGLPQVARVASALRQVEPQHPMPLPGKGHHPPARTCSRLGSAQMRKIILDLRPRHACRPWLVVSRQADKTRGCCVLRLRGTGRTRRAQRSPSARVS